MAVADAILVDLEAYRAARIERAAGVVRFNGARVAAGRVVVAVDGDDAALVFTPDAARAFAMGLMTLADVAEREGT